MSDESENLIDLSIKESAKCDGLQFISLTNVCDNKNLTFLIPPVAEIDVGRSSLDNNPLNALQKIATKRQNDIIEKEASLKKKVKLAKNRFCVFYVFIAYICMIFFIIFIFLVS